MKIREEVIQELLEQHDPGQDILGPDGIVAQVTKLSVCSLTPCFFAVPATVDRSASRRILTICSSVNRLFRMASFLSDRCPRRPVPQL
jgi:hypothetical protein